MSAQVLGRTGAASGLTFTIGEMARVGRDRANEVCVAAEGVARLHATIAFTGGTYWVEDAGSTEGTFVNSRRVTKERLYHLDVISLGRSVDLVFLARAPKEGGAPAAPRAQGLLEVRLIALNGPDAGSATELPKGVTTMGRATQCNLVLPSQAVSKVHAKIERTSNGLSISDLGSSNGTFVNGSRITTVPLSNGDVVVLGQALEFRVEAKSGALAADDAPAELPAAPIPAPTGSPSIPKTQLAAMSTAWKARYDSTPGEDKEEKAKAAAGAGSVERPKKTTAEVPAQKPAAAAKPAPKPPEPPKPVETAKPPELPETSQMPQPDFPPPVPPAAPAAVEVTMALGPVTGLVLTGKSSTLKAPLGDHVVGRVPTCSIFIDDTRVSRSHARLQVDGGGAIVTDLKSGNGTFVNGKRLLPETPRPVQEGDTLGFAEQQFAVGFERSG